MTIFFFFNDTATTEIYTLSLHDALPISKHLHRLQNEFPIGLLFCVQICRPRSEEHTSELQSRLHLVCRLLLEKKKKNRLPSLDDSPRVLPVLVLRSAVRASHLPLVIVVA